MAAGVFLLVVLLGLLAIPLLGVPGDARAAKTDLTRTMKALERGDAAVAREAVTDARTHLDEARGGVEGFGGDVWATIPFLGTPVADAQHLVAALDEATSVAEIGVDLYPAVAGKKATLLRDEQVDADTLDRVIDGAKQAYTHLQIADAELSEVDGTTPLVGDTIAANRDDAAEQLSPLVETFTDVRPMLDELPELFGFEGRQQYLIALLNPADNRYSGGTPLAFATMTWQDGKVEVSDSLDLRSNKRLIEPIRWPRVEGNYFHYRGPMRMRNATFAPSWSVSGEELLRAWEAASGEKMQGVLAADLISFSRLFEVTGDVTVPSLGKVTAANLVEKLVGSYDDYYPDASAHDEAAAGVIGPFRERLFGGGDYVAKAQALGEAADGRHFAFYSRNPVLQEGGSALGLDGDLTSPDGGDYLGVFSQSVLPSKSDFWHDRSVDLDVRLGTDGAADHELDVRVHNDSPPYAVPEPDPGQGYFTRWTGFALGVFVPAGAEVADVSVPGQQWGGFVGDFYDHDFFYRNITLEPQARTRLRASYTVPEAASVAGDGSLSYRLAIDPHALVRPQSMKVTVRLPEGYRAVAVPEGWRADGETLTWSTDGLDASARWEIRAEPGN